MAYRRSVTGRGRDRRTRRRVALADAAARAVVAVGGIGIIVAVSLVCLFLVWVVIPLFLSASTRNVSAVPTPWEGAAAPWHVALDEYQRLGWVCRPGGRLLVFRLDTGDALEEIVPFPERSPTAAVFSIEGGNAAFGFADGTISLGKVGFATRFLAPEDVPSDVRAMPVGEARSMSGGMVERVSENQFRFQRLAVDFEEPFALEGRPSAIRLIDYTVRGDGPFLAVLTASGELRCLSVRTQRNFMTGRLSHNVSEAHLPYTFDAVRGEPRFLMVSGLGDNVFLAWSDGTLARYDTRDLTETRLAQTLDLVEEEGESLTAARFLIGRATILAGDSRGRLSAWFRIRPDGGALTPDGLLLVRSHVLPVGGAPVTALAVSARSRLALAGYADGFARIVHVTSHKILAEESLPGDAHAVGSLAMAPKEDGFFAAHGKTAAHWRMDPRHPEVTFASILKPVWYEGYSGPAHVWQSSSGTDAFEPKFGLMPLVFSTVKATLYSMLFGLPLAILAAIYTSEFLSVRAKARVKPAIELMAGLPSVVLGFLAALVFAPFVERVLPAALAAFATVPWTFLAGAFVWQILPERAVATWVRWRLGFMGAALVVGLALAAVAGPFVERVLFAGDIQSWLDGQIGDGTGGWLMLFLPLSAVAGAWGTVRWVNPWICRIAWLVDRRRAALTNAVKFAAASVLTAGLAIGLSAGLAALGFDPRGSYVDTYVQRNAFVVGITMGFAVIPIIYTIAEDALSAVPEHLRAASLGAGATPWQTATRIVIPTAMSGLFSAVMVGLGRAVGETMIVLMAAGNTPVMEWNVFNGFRTLSANIAVELPEAPRDGTHYRMLFLAALVLFAMTFVVNTVAEIVRLRFRRRAYQL